MTTRGVKQTTCGDCGAVLHVPADALEPVYCRKCRLHHETKTSPLVAPAPDGKEECVFLNVIKDRTGEVIRYVCDSRLPCVWRYVRQSSTTFFCPIIQDEVGQ